MWPTNLVIIFNPYVLLAVELIVASVFAAAAEATNFFHSSLTISLVFIIGDAIGFPVVRP